MPPLNHDHPVDAVALHMAQSGVIRRDEAERLSRLLGLLHDPVRLRLMFALASVDELCVGDLTMALQDVNEDQTSYALKLLRTAGLVQTRREGRVVHYRLSDGFPHQLLDHCLRQLLTISEKARN